MDFKEVIRKARLSPPEIALITQRSPRTVRRWINTGKAPRDVTERLRAITGLEIPSGNPEWSGWSIVAGRLRDPDGNEYTPGEIRSIWIVRELRRELEKRANGPAQYLLDI